CRGLEHGKRTTSLADRDPDSDHHPGVAARRPALGKDSAGPRRTPKPAALAEKSAPRKARLRRAFPRELFPCARAWATIAKARAPGGSAIMRRSAVSILIAMSFGFAVTHARAADLTVLSAGPVDGTFRKLAPAFTRATGHKVEATFDTVGAVQNKLKAGEKADVIILSAAAIDELEKAGALLAGSGVEVGRGMSGLAVRAGARVPDISTPDAFKRTLLAARSVAYVDPAAGATTGIFFAKLLERLEIADEVNKKA